MYDLDFWNGIGYDMTEYVEIYIANESSFYWMSDNNLIVLFTSF
jgi:hypothetical protein